MKQLIFILLVFVCMSSQGQGYMNTSINPLVDTSYHGRFRSSFILPTGNLLMAVSDVNKFYLLKTTPHGDTLKSVYAPLGGGISLLRIHDNLYCNSSINNLTLFDSNLNNLGKFAIPNMKGSIVQYSFEKNLAVFGTSLSSNTDTAKFFYYRLSDSICFDSLMILKSEIIDTGTVISIYNHTKVKNGKIITGVTDYIKSKNGPQSENYYIALLDSTGHILWKHKTSQYNNVYGNPYLMSSNDSTIRFVALSYKDSLLGYQLLLYNLNLNGDTLSRQLLIDSAAQYYSRFYIGGDYLFFTVNFSGRNQGKYLVTDTFGNIKNYITRENYSKRFVANIHSDGASGWIEVGSTNLHDTPNTINNSCLYIAHLDSVFCTYTKPEFDIGHVSGIFTVSLLNKSKNLFLDSIYSYHWIIDLLKGDSIPNSSVLFKDTGTHYIALKIMNKSGCESNVQKSVYINYPLGINEVHNKSSLSVLNNPFKDELNIINNANYKVDIKLCDISGRTVTQMTLNGAGIYNLNTAELNAGIYYLYNLSDKESFLPIKLLKVQ